MTETRGPEDMPSDWRIGSFSHEQGLATLRRDGEADVHFGIEVWDIGDWRPSRKEAALVGASSPVLPRAGEPVRVRWKRSVRGLVVPALVQPVGRVSSTEKAFTLAAWLKRAQRHGLLGAARSKDVLRALSALDEHRAEEWSDGEPHAASEYAFLLLDLATAGETDPAWASGVTRIYADDHRWDRERARRTLAAVLGVAPGPEPANASESLPEYAARCSAEAEHAGLALRWHEIALEGDAHVLVAMEPASFESLVASGHLLRD